MTENELRQAAFDIRAAHRKACFARKQVQRNALALGAYVRLRLGWRKDLPAKQREAIRKHAAAIIAADAVDNPELRKVVKATADSAVPFEVIEVEAVREMEHLVKSIPFMKAFVDETRGIGLKGIGIIIAEACNDQGALLSDYPKKGHLWKRMGVGLIEKAGGEFVRQGNAGKNASAETWIRHGYNKERRSRLFTVGESVIKAQIRYPKDENKQRIDGAEPIVRGAYGALYLARKAYETEKVEAAGMTILRAGDPKPKKGSNATYVPAMVIHRRAQRYMEKRLLNDLRKIWRREVLIDMPSKANASLPPVSAPTPLPMAAE